MSPVRCSQWGGMRDGVRRACQAPLAGERIKPQEASHRTWSWKRGRGLLRWRSRRRQPRHGFECSLRILMLLAIVLAATWSRISEMTGRFGTDPNGDAVYQHAARWSRIEALGQAGPPQLRNTLDMQLVLIPPGRFVMGSPSREEYRSSDEWPHRVEITRAFYLGTCEVTVAQFRRFVEATDYRTQDECEPHSSTMYSPIVGDSSRYLGYTWRSPGFFQEDDHPVVCVSWQDATAFCRWLSHREGCHYRLPTEAEWEYACRAGTSGAFSVRYDGLSFPAGNLRDTGDSRHYSPGADWTDGYRSTSPVGSFPSNAFGLYDMHGNVEEWCADWYGADFYRHSPRSDPHGPQTGTERLSRGGSFIFPAFRARSANRTMLVPRMSDPSVGFRVVREYCGN